MHFAGVFFAPNSKLIRCRYPVSQRTVELVKTFFSNDIMKHADLYMSAANIPGWDV